jgi:uncharacterized membrane protein SirB2
MIAKWMTELIVLDDIFKNTPPALKAGIDKWAVVGNTVDTVLAITGVSLLSLTAIESKVQVDQA